MWGCSGTGDWGSGIGGGFAAGVLLYSVLDSGGSEDGYR